MMELTIPTSWADITLGQYIELRPILETEMDEVKKVINILCRVDG